MLNQECNEGDITFDTGAAARYLGCSPGHLKKLRQIGSGRASGCGPVFHRLFHRKGVQYRRSDLDAWLAARRFESTTEYPESFL